MALPRKGSRKIVIDGVRYNWTVRNDHSPGNPRDFDLRLYVERSERPAGLLTALLRENDV